MFAVGAESPPLSVSEERQLAILTELPFVVPFEERVKVWYAAASVLTCCSTLSELGLLMSGKKISTHSY